MKQHTHSAISVYAGRTLLGTVRPSAGNVYAFATDGSSAGTFRDQRGFTIALAAQATSTMEEGR